MGIYLNPGKERYQMALNSEVFVDKTEMIGYINKLINSDQRYISVSRPRRFGKTMATDMLTAYYDSETDSRDMFSNLKIAKVNDGNDWDKYLNSFDVIRIVMTDFIKRDKDIKASLDKMCMRILDDYSEAYPDVKYDEDDFNYSLEKFYRHSNRQFVIIIDEWDVVFRVLKDDEASQTIYLDFLRDWLKGKDYVALAYMTGILPIKKDGSQSAVSEFSEYTIFDPEQFAPYIGFTEEEVKGLCERKSLDFAEMKRWYDGYNLPGAGDMYNANSVMKAASSGKFKSYWSASSAANSLLEYLNMDFDGLGDDVDNLLKGKAVRIDNSTFLNDMYELYSRDDVLTLLTHFGYLAYDNESGYAHVPNLEIRIEYDNISRRVRHQKTIDRLKECDELFKATAAMDEKKVAEGIQKVHERECSPRHYNREDSLRSVIKLAYYTYKDEYLQLEEAGGGTGYADIVYIPRKYSDMPLLIIELKKDDTPENAIKQIRDRNYAAPYEDMDVDILLVGVTYDSNDPAKTHRCVIEEYER